MTPVAHLHVVRDGTGPADHPSCPVEANEGSTHERTTEPKDQTTDPRVRSAHPSGSGRPTPYESGLAAVARHDVHIERVWPMRSPSTGALEESSSAHFQVDRRGTPPAKISPVGGLRMSQAYTHQPVMVAEVADLFEAVPTGLIVDATIGGGGHAAALLAAHPGVQVLGIDRDPAAVRAASEALAPYGARATVRRGRFDQLDAIVRRVQAELGTPDEELGLSGAMFDLGVSSPQLDESGRGFSYRTDAPLDMRMDPTEGKSAADVVNEYDEDSLVSLFAANGEGRFARRIAHAIVGARPIRTTGELSDVVRGAVPAAARRSGHPARRVFQAIRIEVNEEIEQVEAGVEQALGLLRPGGRCVVISYHSGEDRLVKSAFTRAATGNCQCPPGLPCVCGADPDYRLLFRGVRRPTGAEVERNRRAEAARLRVVERVTGSPSGSRTDGEVA
jgi:16S rRNA (cytosine1402-N4)-methyltransferase